MLKSILFWSTTTSLSCRCGLQRLIPAACFYWRWLRRWRTGHTAPQLGRGGFSLPHLHLSQVFLASFSFFLCSFFLASWQVTVLLCCEVSAGWNKPDSHTKLCRCQGAASWTSWLRIGSIKNCWRSEVTGIHFFFPVPPQHRCLWLSLILRQHALPFCIVCFGLSFRTIICKLQFLVLVYMQRLHWFN